MAPHPALVPRLAVRPDPAAVGPLWLSFHASRDHGIRTQLVNAYLGFARMMAAKVYARRTFTDMEFGDYLQYAHVGLLEAVDRFDPQRGILFESFAAVRITGAVLTGLESASEIQRQIAARKRVVSARAASLNPPAVSNGAEAVFARLAEIALGLAVGFALEESNMYAQEEAEFADNTYAGLELKQLKVRVAAAVEALSPGARRVIQAHYLQHMQFDEVAASMGLTGGRVSQIHKEALEKLRILLKRNSPIDLSC